MASILIVDDDPHIREVVRYALEKAGHRVEEASDGADGLAAALASPPDVVILDIVMPGLDGIEVCRRLRTKSNTPILFLSSKDDEIDRVIGLEVGGDDYVTKPFSPRELVARVKAMLRRIESYMAPAKPRTPNPSRVAPEPEAPEQRPLERGRLTLDPVRFEVAWGGERVVLTVTEFGLLETLLRQPGKVYTRAELVERAYTFDNHVTERTIDTHVRRIRKKFDADGEPIETVFGVGYRLGDCGAS